MENVNFEPSGEEIERALMDLGPLLGVSIKEELPDDLPDLNAPPASALNVSSTPDGMASGSTGGDLGVAVEGGDGADGSSDACKGSGVDCLSSPSATRAPFSDMRCVLCHVTLAVADGTPKLMECLHSICEPCVKAKIEEKHASSRDFLGAERVTVMCPACRLQCQVANMIDQRFVLEKIALEQAGSNGAALGEQQCNSCEDTEPATSYCVDCAEFICDNCVHAHQRLKITKDHTIKSKEEAVSELQAAQGSARSSHDMFCAEHVQERLSLFCETCDRLTCRDCQLQHHRDHKYQFSTEMAAQARGNISSLLSEVSYKRVLLGSAMKVIRDRQQLIADKKRALVHEITQTVVKLTNAINTRGKQLVLRLNEVCDSKQRTLTEKKEALQQLAAITDHCVQFVTGALAGGSDTAVLHAKHAVCAHLQRIKSRRADIPNPEIPVRISLALDKLPDLVRVLSTIGAIVVDGKVDGGSAGGGAQGPYHPPALAGPPALPGPPAQPGPPAPPAPPAARAQPAHSAVVALQHVAMHQRYCECVFCMSVVRASGGRVGRGGRRLSAAAAAAAARALAHAAAPSARHQHHPPPPSARRERDEPARSAERAVAAQRGGGGGAPARAAPRAARAARHAPRLPADDRRVRVERVRRRRGRRGGRGERGQHGGRAAQRRAAHALARAAARLPAPAPAARAAAPPAPPARARRQVAHPATLAHQRWVRDERGRYGRGRRARLQDHAGAARAARPARAARAARRRHLHQPQDAQPQPQRRRPRRAGQGVRGVRAGPDGHHRQAGLERRAGGGGGRAGAVARAARALLHGRRAAAARRPPHRARARQAARPQRGLVRRLHGRRRAHVLRQVPQGLPPVLPHPHHRQAARRDGDVAVPAVRQLRGARPARGRRARGGRGRPAAAPPEAGGARHAGAVLPVRDQPALPRARARPQRALPLHDLPADVSGHDPHEAAAAQPAPLLARGAVRRRLPAALPQRLPIQRAGQPAVQGREAARGVLRRAAGEVAAGVRVLERRGRAARQAAADRLTRAARPSRPSRARRTQRLVRLAALPTPLEPTRMNAYSSPVSVYFDARSTLNAADSSLVASAAGRDMNVYI